MISSFSDLHLSDEDNLNHSGLDDNGLHGLLVRELEISEQVILNGDIFELYQSGLPTFRSQLAKFDRIRRKFPKSMKLIEEEERIILIKGNHDEILDSLLKKTLSEYTIFHPSATLVFNHGIQDFTGKHFPWLQFLAGWGYGWVERLLGFSPQHWLNRFLEEKFQWSVFSNSDQIKHFKSLIAKNPNGTMVLFNGHTHLSQVLEFNYRKFSHYFINTGSCVYGVTKITRIDLDTLDIFQDHRRTTPQIGAFLASLQPGDILLSLGDGAVSKLIGNIFDLEYSHGMLYIGKGKVLESTGESGVQVNALQHYLEEEYNLAILRLKDNPDPRLLIRNARKYVNVGYGLLGVVLGAVLKLLQRLLGFPEKQAYSLLKNDRDPKIFCFELLGKILKDTYNIQLEGKPSHVLTSEDFLKSELMQIILEVKRIGK